MASLLTPAQKAYRNAWLNAYIVLPNGLSQKFPDFTFSVNWSSNFSKAEITDHCKDLYNCICTKIIDISAYKILCEIADNTTFIIKNKDARSPYNAYKSKAISSDLACAFLIDWTNDLGIIWNDEVMASNAAEELKNSYLGQLITRSKAFKSQQYNNATKARVRTTNQNSTSGQPQNAYKSTGSQINNVVGLISAPGQKENVPNVVYKVIADKFGANVPQLFVNPVENATHGFKAKINANSELLVNVGSGNGYTDFPCYFIDKATAEKFLQAFLASGKTGGKNQKYTNWRVGAFAAKKSGYYKFMTEFGPVYLGATKLNELLEPEDGGEILQEAPEEIEEDYDEYNFKIDDPMEFTEIMMKYE